MQTLNDQLTSVGRTLDSLTSTTPERGADPRSVKLYISAVDHVIERLNAEIATLQTARSAAAEVLSAHIASVAPRIAGVAEQLGIALPQMAPAAASTVVVAPRTVDISLVPGVRHRFPVYESVAAIPPMSYGAVSGNQIVYKYHGDNYVGVQVPDITDHTDTYRTVSCSNPGCTFGNACRYYHDPATVVGSSHTPRFARTSLVPACQYFGAADDLRRQLAEITFANVRGLARYVAIMNLLIGELSERQQTQ